MQNPARFPLFCFALASIAFGQQTKTIAAASRITGPEASAGQSGAAAEVLEFERNLEAAVVRGDVAYVDKASADNLIFTHGDGWTTGGKPLLVDDKKGFLKRVENKQYLVRDLDSVCPDLGERRSLQIGKTQTR